ncbi:hypothetical protein RHMOL_Rhmol02G0128800 [Rhododendron molle]|uniref:Uncharacterized protein n=1 Tax=Rhododendron molle TaxID=49168 RepID=A0ACC0PQU4_RHOML|nr:hypothetical protein RHMOL_Rhmol02G0128800 [Rhododendron molle]
MAKAARVLDATAASDQDGTAVVRKDKTVIPSDGPAGILTTHDQGIPKSCSSKDKGISPPPFVVFTDFNSIPLNPTFSITRLDPNRNHSPSEPDYFVEEPPDSPGRINPLSSLGPPVQNKPLLDDPSDISPFIKFSPLDPNLATKSLPSPNPPSTIGLSSIFDKFLCLKLKSPPSSPSHISPPLKLHKPDQSVEASYSPDPDIPSPTPEELEAFIHPGILSLAQPVGDSRKARKSVTRRASSFKRKATETTSSPHQSLQSSRPLHSSHWIPPRVGYLKINCDASWSRDLKKGWGGIILKNDRGHLVDGRRFRISSSSAFLAEDSVLREACLFAKALNLSSVCIENDNAQLISLCVSELVPPWEALAIISDIRLLASNLRLSFCWTPPGRK